MHLLQSDFEDSGFGLEDSNPRRIRDRVEESIEARVGENPIEISIEIRDYAHPETPFKRGDDLAAVLEASRRFAYERGRDSFHKSMPTLGAALLKHRADFGRSGLAEILELVADKESHQVGQAEAGDDPRGSVSGSGRMVEGWVEFRATDFNARGSISAEKAVEPMRWPVERAAEVEQQCTYVRHERPTLPVEIGRL